MARGTKRFSHNLLVAVLLGIGVLGALPAFVRAEIFFDVYGGLVTTGNSEVKEQVSFRPQNGATTKEEFQEDANFSDSFTVGGRIGYWTERWPWVGVAFDGSYFKADDKQANIELPVVGLSFLVMMRYPLFTNEQFPAGRIQPYLGIGPELAFTKIKAELKNNQETKTIHEHVAGGGVDVRTGLLWQIHQHWGIFTEYRFTYIGFDTNSPLNFYGDDIDDIDDDDIPEGGLKIEDIETSLTSHHFLVGISFRF
jgi:opacity protein-like surface antigen